MFAFLFCCMYFHVKAHNRVWHELTSCYDAASHPPAPITHYSTLACPDPLHVHRYSMLPCKLCTLRTLRPRLSDDRRRPNPSVDGAMSWRAKGPTRVLTCYSRFDAQFKEDSRKPVQCACAHFAHTHTKTHTEHRERERERESTHFFFLHIHREEHTAAECLKGKRLHHLVVWQETFGHVFIRGDFRTVSSHSHRIYKHLNDRISIRLKFWSKIQIKGSKLKAKKHVIHSIILWATVLFMTFLLKCVSHCKLKHAAWHNYWYGPKKLLEIIYFIFF